MATNPSVSAEEDCRLMVRLLGVQKTLSCVPFWSSECKKGVARLEKVKRSTMKVIKGMDNEEKLKEFLPGGKKILSGNLTKLFRY